MTWHLRGRGWQINVKRTRRLASLRHAPSMTVLLAAQDGPDANLSASQDQHAGARAQDLPVLAARPGDRPIHQIASRRKLCFRLPVKGCTDITYIPLARGFLYLVAIMDWWSRKVLAWRLCNIMEAAFCVDALEEAMDRHGKPEIFSSNQGSQFTSIAFTQTLKADGVRISMDGKGRWLDNVFVERLWRSLKYACVHLHAWSGGREARDGIGFWMTFYNRQRPQATHGGQTPDAVYHQPDTTPPTKIAA